jgi:preprotein translocase subunit SecA
MKIVSKLLRAGEGKKLKALQSLVPDINALEPEIQALSDEALKAKTNEFRQRLDNGEDLNDLLLEAFAVVREGAWRVIGKRHFDVQLMGGAALHFGWIAEMKTGEGKTLVGTLPLYLNGLTGKGVHLVTVNDYLASFHAEWMGQVYRWLGLTVGTVLPGQRDNALKRQAYAADITYGTTNEFGFDYLRDNMAPSREAQVQRGHVYAIVDEVDSILIDEARVPLIISGPAAQAAKLYYQFAGIVRGLQRDVDYEVDEEKHTVVPTEEGITKVEQALGVDNLYDAVSAAYVHQLGNALRAKELYRRDREYLVTDGEVKIVDQFTGRILEGRRWSDGLHQAVEAKERVRIKDEDHTWATVTLQNYFRMYDKLAGMTGTALTEAGEFAGTYGLPVVPIPTNKPMVRIDQPDLIYRTEAGKFGAAVNDIAERFERGQPVLVGTASVEKSEVLSRLLEKRGIPHEVLNAKQHTREADIVAQAGRLHSVTVATNMAGRGVDILLGGNPEGLARQETIAGGIDPDSEEGRARQKELLPAMEAACAAEGDKVRQLGGLYVLGSERHEARRIDNQLRGRAGRQGDPGESRFYLSLEDDLMRLFATGALNWVMGKSLPEDQPIEAGMVTKAIERAQTSVEARNAEIRKDILKYDEVRNEQRKVIYARRNLVLDGQDLREETLEILDSAISGVVAEFAPDDYPENWDVDGLHAAVTAYYPTKFTAEELGAAATREQLEESLKTESLAYYEERERSMPGGVDQMRQLERQIMLQIIDHRWREHLIEMDHLYDGIFLRAMGQKDPLTEWTREGYEMFGLLMGSIDADYVKYVMHAQIVVEEPAAPDLDQAHYVSADGPVQGAEAMRQSAAPPAVTPQTAAVATAVGQTPPPGAAPAAPQQSNGGPQPAGQPPAMPETMAPVVKSEHEKTGRNQPCWCGSGKKFKNCHGR